MIEAIQYTVELYPNLSVMAAESLKRMEGYIGHINRNGRLQAFFETYEIDNLPESCKLVKMPDSVRACFDGEIA